MLANAVVDYESLLYSGKNGTGWYESLLDSTHVDQVDTCKSTVMSRGIWNILLYRLLDINTWMKCEMSISLDINRGNVPQLDIPVSMDCICRHDTDVVIGLEVTNKRLGKIHEKGIKYCTHTSP